MQLLLSRFLCTAGEFCLWIESYIWHIHVWAVARLLLWNSTIYRLGCEICFCANYRTAVVIWHANPCNIGRVCSQYQIFDSKYSHVSWTCWIRFIFLSYISGLVSRVITPGVSRSLRWCLWLCLCSRSQICWPLQHMEWRGSHLFCSTPLWGELAPIAHSYTDRAFVRFSLSIQLVTITVISSTYATQVYLENFGPKVISARLSSNCARSGFIASVKSIMLRRIWTIYSYLNFKEQ